MMLIMIQNLLYRKAPVVGQHTGNTRAIYHYITTKTSRLQTLGVTQQTVLLFPLLGFFIYLFTYLIFISEFSLDEVTNISKLLI